MNCGLLLSACGLTVLSIFTAACEESEEEILHETYTDNSPKIVRYYHGKGKNRDLAREVGYYSSGLTEFQKSYLNGERHGLWTYWYPNGKKWSQCEYGNGRRNGKITVWYENGNKRYEGTYRNDRKKSLWKFWNDDGELVKEMEYGL